MQYRNNKHAREKRQENTTRKMPPNKEMQHGRKKIHYYKKEMKDEENTEGATQYYGKQHSKEITESNIGRNNIAIERQHNKEKT